MTTGSPSASRGLRERLLTLAEVSQLPRVVVGSTYTWVWLLVLVTLVRKPEPARLPSS